MANYKITLQYDGTCYYGFQFQPELPTIQSTLENAIGRVGSLQSPLYAAGRTDAGVHARGQVVSFKASMKPQVDKIPTAMNSFLPPDIVITDCGQVDEAFNARRSALAREYAYYLSLEKHQSPFNRRFTYHCNRELDVARMAATLDLILGEHDFAAFSKKMPQGSTVREVHEAGVFMGDRVLAIRVKANAFVWMMMRMLCGSILQVGKGAWSVERFRKILESRDNAGSAAALPPQGLVLEEVYY